MVYSEIPLCETPLLTFWFSNAARILVRHPERPARVTFTLVALLGAIAALLA
jgi:hypothetical protein